MTRLIAWYIIVEPGLRNAMQVAAGAVAVDRGQVALGLGLLAWALIDMAIKGRAGVLLLKRRKPDLSYWRCQARVTPAPLWHKRQS